MMLWLHLVNAQELKAEENTCPISEVHQKHLLYKNLPDFRLIKQISLMLCNRTITALLPPFATLSQPPENQANSETQPSTSTCRDGLAAKAESEDIWSDEYFESAKYFRKLFAPRFSDDFAQNSKLILLLICLYMPTVLHSKRWLNCRWTAVSGIHGIA